MNERITQNQTILQYLKQYRTITQRDAFQFGCYRLASRISELKKAGHDITTEIVYEKNRNGDQIHYARYFYHDRPRA